MKMEMTRRNINCNCINLRRAANAITEYYDRTLKPCGLTSSQFSLLTNLTKIGICSVSDLAEYVGLERTTLVRTLKPLFEKEYIEDISPVGTRNRQMKVTHKGLQILEIGDPLWEEAQNAVKTKIGEENIKLLTHLLSLIESI